MSAMDVSTLSPEDLMRLSEMLPTENEIRALAVSYCFIFTVSVYLLGHVVGGE